LAAALVMVLLAGSLLGWLAGAAVPLVSLFSFLLLAGLVGSHHGGRRFGAANVVTLARGVGMTLIAGLAVEAWLSGLETAAVATAVVLGAVCIGLDGVDGKVARARGEMSAFGARFDMETDAATILVLSVAVVALDYAGWWVLAIGTMRYLYVAASWLVPALRIPVRVRVSGRAVAVLQGLSLLACLLLGLLARTPAWWPSALAGAALAALTWSFGRDIAWQLRTARARMLLISRAASADEVSADARSAPVPA
jgi:phosphatidylglycerophosphate synthase